MEKFENYYILFNIIRRNGDKKICRQPGAPSCAVSSPSDRV